MICYMMPLKLFLKYVTIIKNITIKYNYNLLINISYILNNNFNNLNVRVEARSLLKHVNMKDIRIFALIPIIDLAFEYRNNYLLRWLSKIKRVCSFQSPWVLQEFRIWRILGQISVMQNWKYNEIAADDINFPYCLHFSLEHFLLWTVDTSIWIAFPTKLIVTLLEITDDICSNQIDLNLF